MKFIIDGENFRHQITEVLYRRKIMHEGYQLWFDFGGFCRELLGSDVEVFYYTTEIIAPHFAVPKKLSERLHEITIADRRWVKQLREQGITVVRSGNLRVKHSIPCPHCGQVTQQLHEKGADVRVAAELVLQAMESRNIALGSSDTDLIPAIEAAKKLGAHITYVCYEPQVTEAIAAIVDEVRTFDDQDVLRYLSGEGHEN